MVELESPFERMSLPLSIYNTWPLGLLVAVPFVWWIARRTRTMLARRHLNVVTRLRTLGVIFIALALMQPQWRVQSDEISVVYALDVSRSIAPAFIESALNWIEEANRQAQPARASYIAFADRAVTLSTLDEIRKLRVAEGSKTAQTLDSSASNLERGLDSALLGLDGARVKRLVLLSDGNQTEGEVRNLLPRLKQAGVRVFPIAAKVRDPSDAWLETFELPDGLRAGEPVTLTLRAFAHRETAARVRIRDGAKLLGVRDVRLNPGFNPIEFEVRLPRPGAVSLTAELQVPEDGYTGNNRVQVAAWVGARARVLMVEGEANRATVVRDALGAENIDVKRVTPVELATLTSSLNEYDAVLMSDVPGAALSAETMDRIQSYVRDAGGGLVFAGGENVFGEKGYSNTALEKILPVEFKSQEKRRDLALVIAIDRSYSMKGRKMEMAKEATRAALELLEEQHYFAVVAFDSQPYIAVPMQLARSRRKAEDQISRIQASGQTNIYPALGIVFRLLQKAEPKTRHVILLSDGDTHPAEFETLLKRMSGEKIVVSTVAIGEGADHRLMGDIARWGKGRAYTAIRADEIPQIFVEETQRAVRSNLLEEAFKPVLVRQSQVFRGLDMNTMPPLKGYVSTKPRDHVEVLMKAPNGSPLLARWQYGLGKAVMFTSDIQNRWAADWIEWKGFGKLWAQITRETLRRDSGEQLDFRVARLGDQAVITLSLLTAEGRFRADLVPRVKVNRADGTSVLLDLRQSGPGSYRAQIAMSGAVGNSTQQRIGQTDPVAEFRLLPSAGLDAAAIARTGVRRLFRDYGEEYRSRPPDLDLLDTLTRETGGKRGAEIADIFAALGENSQTRHPIGPWLALMALFCFLLDIAARRSPMAWRWLGS
jgi:Ca-activated chloride channel homolog